MAVVAGEVEMRALVTRTDGVQYLLSKKERDILEVIAEAEKPLSIAEICERACCTKKTYQNFMNRKNFRDLLGPCLNYLVERNLVPIVGSLVSRSKQGSVKHQELLFKLLGLLKDNRPELIQIFNFGQKEEEDFLMGEEQINKLLGV